MAKSFFSGYGEPEAQRRNDRVGGGADRHHDRSAVVCAWTEVSGPPIPPVGYAAMIMGVVLSLLVGCGLMALLFYSSRHGYDEQHPPDELG